MIADAEMANIAADITELAYDLRQLEIMGTYFGGNPQQYLDMPREQFYTEYAETIIGGDIERMSVGPNGDSSLSYLLTEFDYIVPTLTRYTSIDLAPYDELVTALNGVIAYLDPLNGNFNPEGTGHAAVVASIESRITDWNGAFVDAFRDNFCKSLAFVGCNQAAIALELAEIAEAYKTIAEQLQHNAWDIATSTKEALTAAVAAGGSVDAGSIFKAVVGLSLSVGSLIVGGPTGAPLALALVGLGKTAVDTVTTIDNAIEAPPVGGGPVNEILGRMNAQLTLINMDALEAETTLANGVQDDVNVIDAWLGSPEQQRFLLPPDVAATDMTPGDGFYPDSLP